MNTKKEDLHIVIVDDEIVNIMLLEALLEEKGYIVTNSFEDPLEAQEYLLSHPCDILLVDYNMPSMTGTTLLKSLKESNPDLVSIMITADQSNDTMLEALDAGANDVLLKPVSAIAFQLKFRNITALADSLKNTKVSNKSLQSKAKQYEELINSSSGFVRLDTELNILDINEYFCNFLKEKKETLLMQNMQEYIEEDFLNSTLHSVFEYLKSDTPWKGLCAFELNNGEVVFFDGNLHAIYNQEGTVEEYMAVGHDVTELIHTQEEIQKTQSDVVFTMGAIGETRSQETGNHVKRVAEYSKELALLYGLSSEDAELLKTASPMHDIGKVGIPDAILNKPGKLTDEEFVIMKTHSNLGYQMLKHSTRPILKAAALVAKEHHEKWDGSGYPQRKSGEDIHIFGRITALADVFDALGSDRCYKKAWKDEDIFALLKEQSGKHFEPKLIELFFDNLDTFFKIRDSFKD